MEVGETFEEQLEHNKGRPAYTEGGDEGGAVCVV